MKALCDARTKAVAANIRRIREHRNYTQEYLAAKLGISQNAYSKLELGYCNITVCRLFHIAEVLEIEVANLFYAGDDITSFVLPISNRKSYTSPLQIASA